jgi:hypothetical protein
MPLFYVLMKRKDRSSYNRLFALIKELRPQMDPVSVATDFEMAEFGAIAEAWPNAHIHGCWFHLNQSMHRKVSSLGNFSLLNIFTSIFRSQDAVRL